MKDLLFEQQRSAALVVPCPYCHAEANQPCVNSKTGEPLGHIPAHWSRLKQADSKAREVPR